MKSSLKTCLGFESIGMLNMFDKSKTKLIVMEMFKHFICS